MGTNHATVFVLGEFLEIKYDSNCSLKKIKEYASNSQTQTQTQTQIKRKNPLCFMP